MLSPRPRHMLLLASARTWRTPGLYDPFVHRGLALRCELGTCGGFACARERGNGSDRAAKAALEDACHAVTVGEAARRGDRACARVDPVIHTGADECDASVYEVAIIASLAGNRACEADATSMVIVGAVQLQHRARRLLATQLKSSVLVRWHVFAVGGVSKGEAGAAPPRKIGVVRDVAGKVPGKPFGQRCGRNKTDEGRGFRHH
jgi:hypothetical protein